MIKFFELWICFKYMFSKTKDRFLSIITIFSFFGIAIGVATLIIVMSVMNGFREELTSKILGINGHMKIEKIGLMKNDEIKDIKAKIIKGNFNLNVSEVLITQSLMSFRNYSSGVIIKGVNSEIFKKRKIFNNKILSSELDNFNKNEGILIGQRLKEKLSINKGDFISFILPNGYETLLGNIPRAASFRVVGFFDIGMYEYDMSLIYFPLKLLQDLTENNRIDYLEVELNDFRDFDKSKKEIVGSLPNIYTVKDWRTLNPTLFNAIEVEKNVMFLILLLIILVAAFNLISSMFILVSNKTRDIGILRVLGTSKLSILKIFIFNGFIIGLCGTFLGLALGILFCLNINKIKDLLEFFSQDSLFAAEIYFFSELPVIIQHSQVLLITVISLVLSLIATIYPSWRATRIQPINLIKWD